MGVILIASNDIEQVARIAGTVESLGHTPLPLHSTENVIEDVLLNGVAMVLLSENLVPYSGWETCELLRADPTIPPDLPILLLLEGRGNVRRLEKSGFDGTLDPAAPTALVGEEFSRLLGPRAAPEGLDPLADLQLE